MSELCDPKRAQKTLDRIKAAMPSDVQQALLPTAQAAVDALPTIADGFFIQKQRASGAVDLVKANGDLEKLEPNKAITTLMRARRNATHGFGGSATGDREHRGSRVLAHHDGSLPIEVAYLPYLYLLGVLTDPANMARRIQNGCRNVNKAP
ncbi:hypothetical protein [Rhodococcus tukisamuensis]|nr:hypothetical protein [Rhodococcus tukisamuensis]